MAVTTLPGDPGWETDHPYSSALLVDGVAYLSGCTPIDRQGNLVTGVEEAFEAALDVLVRRLAVVGLGLEHVVKITYYLSDVALRDEANRQMLKHFEAPRPVRALLAAQRLPYGALVELDAIAHVKGRRGG